MEKNRDMHRDNDLDRNLSQEGNQNNEREPQEGRSDLGAENVGSNQQQSLNRGLADMDPQPSVGTKYTTRGSGIQTKRSVTGSDYDGQLSGE